MSSNIASTKTPSHSDTESVLRVLQLATKQISEDASHSIKMRAEGLNTQMAEKVDEALSDPIQSLLEFGTKVNADILSVLKQIVHLYFESKSELIDQAYVEENHPLHFYIVLRDNSKENKSKLNEFFDSYFLEDFSERFPILFTYSTSDRISRAEGLQRLPLDE